MKRPARLLALFVVAIAMTAAACKDDAPREVTVPDPANGTTGTGPVTSDPVPLDEIDISLTPIAEVDSPVAMAAHPVSGNLYVAEQGGNVRQVVVDRSEGAITYRLTPEPALDLGDDTRARGEQGLLGIAFSPDGDRMYVDYTDAESATVVAEYTMTGDRPDPSTERLVLRVPQPFANHNGGQLTFGPDGFLYIGLGDGGAAGDPQGRAQNPDELLGKILRIDPLTSTATDPYAIPAGNPFQTGGGAPEIWMLGLRNPWRFSFDRATGDLWIGDVGQNTTEEITWLPASAEGAGRGANLGWDLREGSKAFEENGPVPEGLVDPIFEYANGGDNCAVTGGYVYRGDAIPALDGVYLFGDYCAGHVRALVARDGVLIEEADLGVSVATNSLASFGEDGTGEMYVLSTEGTVYKIEPA
jgi:glucose/arabinose dehydrogenase